MPVQSLSASPTAVQSSATERTPLLTVKKKSKFSIFKSSKPKPSQLSSTVRSPASPTTSRASFLATPKTSAAPASVENLYAKNKGELTLAIGKLVVKYVNEKPNKQKDRIQRMVSISPAHIELMKGRDTGKICSAITLPIDVSGFRDLLNKMLQGHAGRHSTFTHDLKQMLKQPEFQGVVTSSSTIVRHTLKVEVAPEVSAEDMVTKSKHLSTQESKQTPETGSSSSASTAGTTSAKSAASIQNLTALQEYYDFHKESVITEFTSVMQKYFIDSNKDLIVDEDYKEECNKIVTMVDNKVVIKPPETVKELEKFVDAVVKHHGKGSELIKEFKASMEQKGHLSALLELKVSGALTGLATIAGLATRKAEFVLRNDLSPEVKDMLTFDTQKASNELIETKELYQKLTNSYLLTRKNYDHARMNEERKANSAVFSAIKMLHGFNKDNVLGLDATFVN